MQQDFYTGIKEIIISDNDLASFYENKELNLQSDLYKNQYIILKNKDNEIIDKFRWDGNELVKLRIKRINNAISGKTKSLNYYQDCIIDMILNNNITVKSCTGIPGGGKSYLFITYGTDLVLKGEFNKLVYVKNFVDIGFEKLGSLPGTLEDKIEPWIYVLYDALGERFIVDKLRNEDKLEVVYLGHTVGRTFGNKSFVIIDDAQQLSKEHIYNLTTRIGHGSVICLAGDIFQIYSNKYKNDNNGLKFLHEQLKGQDFFACVHTKISERSETAQRCAELLFSGVAN